TTRLLQLRRTALPLGAAWYSGHADRLGLGDLTWLRPDGSELHGEDWGNGDRTLGCLIGQPGRARAPLLLLVNADTRAIDFQLPSGVWQCVLDTAQARGIGSWHGQGDVALPVAAHSLQLLAAAGSGVPVPPP
ncbi:MAG: glycogen debranching enzyme GlgX, partial [Rhodoferax sp.]|nr:glycogen debranching enzyme GlgX [Rhodoferax sp.]